MDLATGSRGDELAAWKAFGCRGDPRAFAGDRLERHIGDVARDENADRLRNG
jgi:hypothetical protein